MHDSADPNGPASQHFQAVLLEYSRSPGKFPVGLRQPPLLFASVREILQIAAGRDADTGFASIQQQESLRQAACFFTRTALLYPGADHYALFGLERGADAADLKDRYRLLMRLIHPDFAEAGRTSWPADAAMRVNLAYDVLSSAVQRREYDARLAAASKPPPAAPSVQPRRIRPAARAAGGGMSRPHFKKLVVVCGATGMALVLIVLFMGTPDGTHLVQRRTEPVDLTVAAVQARAPVEPAADSVAPAPPVELPPAVSPAIKGQAPAAPEAAPAAPPAPTTPIARIARTEPPPPEPQPVAKPILVRAEPAAPTVSAAPIITPPPAAPQVQAAPVPDPVPVPVAMPVQMAPPRAVAPPSPPPQPLPVAGLTLAEAQPLLSVLLQNLESGRGELLIDMLDREARGKPAAQALSRQYDNLVDGMRPVRLSHVEFKAEPADGRLLVTGNFRLQAGEQTIGSVGKKMVLRAEFVSRHGTIVMTGLSAIPGK